MVKQAQKFASVPEEDKPVLVALAKCGCPRGNDLKDLALETGYSSQRLSSVARRYSGAQLGRLKVTYIGSDSTSFGSQCPGIANPRTGISARIPAQIFVDLKPARKRS